MMITRSSASGGYWRKLLGYPLQSTPDPILTPDCRVTVSPFSLFGRICRAGQRHYGNHEKNDTFKDVDTLIANFMTDVRRIRGGGE